MAALVAYRVVVVQNAWVLRPGLPSESWDGKVSFASERQVLTSTVEGVLAAIQDAAGKSQRVKPVGSGHSWSRAADPSGEIGWRQRN